MTEPRQVQCFVVLDRPFREVKAALHRLTGSPRGRQVRVASICDQEQAANLPELTWATLQCEANPFSSVELYVRSASPGTELEIDGHWWPNRDRKVATQRDADAFLDLVVQELRSEVDAEAGAPASGRS